MSLGEDIKRAVDIVPVVGAYVQLKQRGKEHWGLCPFHSEKTPSFKVSGARQRFKCFGCGKAGDVIDFVMEIEGLDFREAVLKLGVDHGIAPSTENTHFSPNWKLAGQETAAFDRWLWLLRKKLLARLGAIEQREQAALAFADLCWAEPSLEQEGQASAHVAAWAENEHRLFQEKHQPAQRKVIHDALTLAHQARLVIEAELLRIDREPAVFLERFLREFYSDPDLREVLAA